MKLWERNSGYWLFWTTIMYVITAVLFSIYFRVADPRVFQLLWLLGLILPFIVPALGRWLNLDVEWDRKFMKWFNEKEVPKMIPEGLGVKGKDKENKSEESRDQTMYSIGLTDQNRVSLRMGYSEITMNPQGVQNLIDQLELFKKQIMEDRAGGGNDE